MATPDQNEPSDDSSAIASRRADYWKRNIRLVAKLMCVWFAVSLGAGVLFADWLDQFTIPGTGFKLGFWFAQQGSILTFIALIAIYAWRMNKLDREYKDSAD